MAKSPAAKTEAVERFEKKSEVEVANPESEVDCLSRIEQILS